jgi:16S rRNA (cytidine1402-2'-O)-methyltransferase
MAAAISGLPTSRIAFDGFLPRAGASRRERLTEIARERRTTVLYEAPHRLERTLVDLATTCDPTREIVLARELTKLHEELWRGSLEDALVHVRATEPRGEYAIVLAPYRTDTTEITDTDIIDELTQRIGSGLSTRDAINEVTDALGVPRKRVYTLAIAL